MQLESQLLVHTGVWEWLWFKFLDASQRTGDGMVINGGRLWGVGVGIQGIDVVAQDSKGLRVCSLVCVIHEELQICSECRNGFPRQQCDWGRCCVVSAWVGGCRADQALSAEV
jgi:hypothetical protein